MTDVTEVIPAHHLLGVEEAAAAAAVTAEVVATGLPLCSFLECAPFSFIENFLCVEILNWHCRSWLQGHIQ